MAKAAEPTRPRGRPRNAEPSSTVSAWIPKAAYDRLVRIAALNEMSVSKLAALFVIRGLTDLKRPK